MQNDKPLVICLTPVKNEAWILERFLSAVSLWADHIIIADEQSTDGSREIAARFPKVVLIDNDAPEFHEFHRQEILVKKAREIHGRKLLLALDADEFLTANVFTSPEWNTMLTAPPGTLIRIQWIHPLPRFNQAVHELRFYYFFGFMDDGADFKQRNIMHNTRLPIPDSLQHLYLNDIRLLHYNLVDADRDRSKKRWYMCWELVNKKSSPFNINRSYIHHHVLSDKEPFRKEWVAAYEEKGIDMTSVAKPTERIEGIRFNHDGLSLETLYWWDEEVLDWMKTYGTKKFSKLDIWDKDWETLGKRKFGDQVSFKRPTSLFAKVIIRYIRNTPGYRSNYFIRKFDKLLARIFDSAVI